MSQECTQRDAQAKSVADLERERDNYAKTLAVKPIQHAELVEALKAARRLAHALEADGPTTERIDALLAKIDGKS